MSLPRRLVAEGLGTAFLLAVVIGSGIMGERLSGGNIAIALLANSLATGGGLVVLILIFGPVSGAHFNPAVTLAAATQGVLPWREVLPYIAVQVLGAFAGVAAAHLHVRGAALFCLAQSAHEWRAMVERVYRDLWLAHGHLGLRATEHYGGALCRGCVYHLRLLVYRLDLVRQSCGDHRARRQQHLCRDSPGRCGGVCRGATAGSSSGDPALSLAPPPTEIRWIPCPQ